MAQINEPIGTKMDFLLCVIALFCTSGLVHLFVLWAGRPAKAGTRTEGYEIQLSMSHI